MAETPDLQLAPAASQQSFSNFLFGRSALIGVASLMLLAISGYATWIGMTDFIVGVQTGDGSSSSRDIVGGLSVTNDMLIFVVVIALTLLMYLALRETVAVGSTWSQRLITLPLYIFLALWSIGFGYGFWWSLIAGSEATRTSLSGLQEDARDAAATVSARLDAVQNQLNSVVSWSESQMQREETSGGSCGTSSGAGRGPLYNARVTVRDGVASLRDGISTSWLGPIQKDIESLRATASSLSGGTVAERKSEFERLASDIRGRARNIATRSNELGKSVASEMRALSSVVSIAPGKPGFSCYDPTLAQRLSQAADQAAEPAVLNLRDAAFTEGPAGVANAVKNLWSNIGTYIGSIPKAFTRDTTETAATTDDGRPITGRDLIALLATLGVDLGLLALALINPPVQRWGQQTQQQLRLPTREVVRQLRRAINTAVQRIPDDKIDMEWVRRHFIHHYDSSYFIIPNLHSVNLDDDLEKAKGVAMNQLAGVLDDLDLVRWPSRKRWRWWKKSELAELREEESKESLTDIAVIKSTWSRGRDEQGEKIKNLRNHGLFSKAETVLKIAGWSEQACRDIEIFKLEDSEGLTPLLMVLNDAYVTDDNGSDGNADTNA
jgi:hypothetical protein